uniref:Nicotinic acetylcholine receptor alpha3 n=1 Tax=Protohermes xanthodes TaxID=1452977 RepID=A0AAU6PBI1_9NEOP
MLKSIFYVLVLCFVVLFKDIEAHEGSGTTPPDVNQRPLWNITHTDKLKRALLLNYDKFARPSQHYNTTVVNVDMEVRHFDLDELKSLFTVHCWVKLHWTDQKLKWNASDFGGLTTLHLADHEIWQPDIVMYNSATGASIDHYGNTHCIAHEDGTVLWVPPSQFVVFCNLNLRYWPFDTQTCMLRLGSWTYDGTQLDLQIDDTETETQLLVENSEWQLKGITKSRNSMLYACCEENYIDITYNITLSRYSPTYKAVVITPAFVVIMMTLLIFWFPPQAGEKILLAGCTAIVICLFLLYFTQKLPAFATNTPLVVLFYSSSLYLVCFAIIISVIVMHISRTQHTTALPWFIKKPLSGWLGKVLGLQTTPNPTLLTHRVNAEELREQNSVTFDEQNSADDHQMIASTPKPVSQQDWILFAMAIDRIFFLFYSFLFAILAIVYSI